MLIQRVGDRSLSFEIPLPKEWRPAPGWKVIEADKLPLQRQAFGTVIPGYVSHPALRPMLSKQGQGLAVVRLVPNARIANLTVPSTRSALSTKLKEMREDIANKNISREDLVGRFVRDRYGDVDGYVVDVRNSAIQGFKRAAISPHAVQEVLLISLPVGISAAVVTASIDGTEEPAEEQMSM